MIQEMNLVIIPSGISNDLVQSCTVPKINYYQRDYNPKDLFTNYYEGEGEIIFKNGCVYNGNMKNGYFHGKGQFTWPDKTKLTLDFKYNKFEGYGRIEYPDGNNYEGDIFNGQKHGKGTLKTKNYEYEGQFQNGKKHGKGVVNYKSGQAYEGDFYNDVKQGKGKVYYASGNTYEGDWFNDKKHGYGIMNWNDQIYQGEWKNDLINGFGQQIWIEKQGENKYQRNRYQGNFQNGLRQGLGVFFYANSSKYEGYWNQNLKDGESILTSQVQEVKYTQFAQDKQINSELFYVDQNVYYQILNIDDLNFDPLNIKRIQNMLMRNNQFLRQVYKIYSNFESSNDRFLNFFGMKLGQFHDFIRETKLFQSQISLSQINRLYHQGYHSQYDFEYTQELLDFKIKYILENKENDSIKFIDLFYKNQIQKRQNNQIELDDNLFQNIFINKQKNTDIHNKETNLLFHQFIDIFIRFFYIKNNYQQENLDNFIENIIQNKLQQIIDKKKVIDFGDQQSKISKLSRNKLKKLDTIFVEFEDEIDFFKKIKKIVKQYDIQLQTLFEQNLIYSNLKFRIDKTVLLKDLIKQLIKSEFIQDFQKDAFILQKIVYRFNEKKKTSSSDQKNEQTIQPSELDAEKKLKRRSTRTKTPSKIEIESAITDQEIYELQNVELCYLEYKEILLYFVCKDILQLKRDQIEKQLIDYLDNFINKNQFQYEEIKGKRKFFQTQKDEDLQNLKILREKQRIEAEIERQKKIQQQKREREITMMDAEDADVESQYDEDSDYTLSEDL